VPPPLADRELTVPPQAATSPPTPKRPGMRHQQQPSRARSAANGLPGKHLTRSSRPFAPQATSTNEANLSRPNAGCQATANSAASRPRPCIGRVFLPGNRTGVCGGFERIGCACPRRVLGDRTPLCGSPGASEPPTPSAGMERAGSGGGPCVRSALPGRPFAVTGPARFLN
jgi:hypothetical protein